MLKNNSNSNNSGIKSYQGGREARVWLGQDAERMIKAHGSSWREIVKKKKTQSMTNFY